MTTTNIEPASPAETTVESRTKAPGEWPDPYAAPLKVVALALRSLRGRGKASEIKQVVTANTAMTKEECETWWKKVQSFASQQFNLVKGVYFFIGSPDSIPEAPLPAKPRKPPKPNPIAEWRKWFTDTIPEPPEGSWPTVPVLNALAKVPSKSAEQARLQVTIGATGFLGGVNSFPHPKQAAVGWFKAVQQTTERGVASNQVDPSYEFAAETAELLTRLALVSSNEKVSGALLETSGIVGKPDAWRQGFASGMWRGLEGQESGIHEFIRALPDEWERRSRESFAQTMILTALQTGYSDKLTSELDATLSRISMAARREQPIIQSAIMQASGGSATARESLLDYLAKSRHAANTASSTERLKVLLLASLLLTNGQGELVREAARGIDEAFAGAPAYREEPVWNGLLSDLRRSFDALRKQKDAEHEQNQAKQAAGYEAKLETQRKELERQQQRINDLEEQNETFRAALDSNREESRYELRKGMLEAIGLTLQNLARYFDDADPRVRNVKTGLRMALRDGGAEVMGKVGDKVLFNSLYHRPDYGQPWVRISAPGVIVLGGSFGDRVLLEAIVSPIGEDS